MTLRYSETLRNAGVDARIAAIGEKPTLEAFDKEGTRLAVIHLPDEWMSKAAGGIANKRGIWTGTAEAKGRVARFEIRDASGAAHMEGSIPEDMTFDNPDLVKGQSVMVGHFVIAAGNR
jgi:hypothetical protein